MATVIQADREAAQEWGFIECRHCSEYEGDFVADLAEAFASHREASTARLEDQKEGLADALNAICAMQAEHFGDGMRTHMALIDLCAKANEALAKVQGDDDSNGLGGGK